MRIHDSLNSAARFASSRWRAAGLEERGEEQRLWAQVNVYRDFISATGHVYLFEDYLKGLSPQPRIRMSTALEARRDAALSQRPWGFF